MRITFRIASAGKCFRPQVPRVDDARCFHRVGGKEIFDEDEFRRQVKDCASIQIAPEDRGGVCAITANMLGSLGRWMADVEKDSAAEAKCRSVRTILARERRGATSCVRMDISPAFVMHNGARRFTVRVRIRYDDCGTVSANRDDRDFALTLVDFALGYSRRYEERGDPPFIFHPDTVSLFADLEARHERIRRRDEVREANIARHKCERLTAGEFCSPCKFDCPHYSMGKCVDLKYEGGRA